MGLSVIVSWVGTIITVALLYGLYWYVFERIHKCSTCMAKKDQPYCAVAHFFNRPIIKKIIDILRWTWIIILIMLGITILYLFIDTTIVAMWKNEWIPEKLYIKTWHVVKHWQNVILDYIHGRIL